MLKKNHFVFEFQDSVGSKNETSEIKKITGTVPVLPDFTQHTFQWYHQAHDESHVSSEDVRFTGNNVMRISRNLVEYYCKCCILIGYATRYLFVVK